MPDDTRRWFNSLFGQAIEDKLGLIATWSLANKATAYHATVEDATADATGRQDTFAAVCLQPPGLGPSTRATTNQVTAMVALWCDIDVGGPNHPPTHADAVSLIQAVGPVPSCVIDSGHGLHGWWFLSEPWDLRQADERTRAAGLARLWVATVQACARARGWTCDAVGDLARIMRVPGTLNAKDPAAVRPVVVLDWTGQRHDVDGLGQYLVAEEHSPSGVAPVDGVTLRPDAAMPDVVMKLLGDDDGFRRTWERKRADMKDQSPSAYCMAIANEGVYRGWPDQVIADAIITWRRLNRADVTKACRRSWMTKTIGKAKAFRQSDAAIQDIEDEGPESGPTSTVSDARKRNLANLAAILQLRVSDWVKVTADPPYYELRLEDGKQIGCGPATRVLNRRAMAAVWYEQGLEFPVQAKAWPAVTRLLLSVERVEALDDATHAGAMRAVVDQYLESVNVHSGERWSDGLQARLPITRDGKTFINLPHMMRWLKLTHSGEQTSREAAIQLRALGWEAADLSARIGGRVVHRHYWARNGVMLPETPPL